ncbi:hypothetical protein K2173_003767 [Erythroxylum novogranatense]|uniref:Uncharacterized protein n=1 Tax=Erythroxylum novogranatense TaxID=1862640 RepID=A0AAV8SJJ1_9ROSI|nr:hypothetical protein K2173_003767 [Erythroxylum novogranatense]
MDFVIGGVGGASSDEQEAYSHSPRGKKTYHRHTSHQIQRLEAFFQDCPHPDENQRRHLSRELGLECRQIKFWFQNKRTQTKAQNERAGNSILRTENERIQCENLAIKEALKKVICPACGGPPFGEEEAQRSLRKLQLENAQLKEEHEKVTSLLAKYIGKPISEIDALMPASGSILNILPQGLANQGAGSSGGDNELNSRAPENNTLSVYQVKGMSEMERALISETAAGALDELIRLLRINEPLWIKPSSSERYVLDRDSYDKVFPRVSHFRSSTARLESSKYWGIVTMNAVNLVEMILDSDKWVDLFPTIVTSARTIGVFDPGMSVDRSGSLQVMHGQMHILSPLVPPREFYFLRHCQRIELGVWVIVDVSYDSLNENISPSRSWRLPSGVMIQEMPNGCSKVIWVEHVEVDDKTQTHRLYRDLISNGPAYGAHRMVINLQRMCERLVFFSREISPTHPEVGGVITSAEGRRSVMELAHRMVKNFCAALSMSGKLDFPQLCEINNSGVRVSVRQSTGRGQPGGTIVSAATSLWLPLLHQRVFDFFTDQRTRLQWDILTNGNPVHEIGHISTGNDPGNCISLIRPFVPTENNIMMLQESNKDPLGSIIVYAPIDIPTMNLAINGKDSSVIPILPSGFIISDDGHSEIFGGGGVSSSSNGGRSSASSSSSSYGSLLTLAFQILVSTSTKELNMESVATVNTLISSTVHKIRVALNCSSIE